MRAYNSGAPEKSRGCALAKQSASRDAGIAGRVATTGVPMNIADAYAEPLFNRAVDQETGYRTRSILCVPILDHRGAVFAVAQALNKRGGGLFAADDERRFGEFTASLGVVLESWWHMAHLRSAA